MPNSMKEKKSLCFLGEKAIFAHRRTTRSRSVSTAPQTTHIDQRCAARVRSPTRVVLGLQNPHAHQPTHLHIARPRRIDAPLRTVTWTTREHARGSPRIATWRLTTRTPRHRGCKRERGGRGPAPSTLLIPFPPCTAVRRSAELPDIDRQASSVRTRPLFGHAASF